MFVVPKFFLILLNAIHCSMTFLRERKKKKKPGFNFKLNWKGFIFLKHFHKNATVESSSTKLLYFLYINMFKTTIHSASINSQEIVGPQ